MVIDTFKIIKTFLCHLSSLDTETEAAYDNYKSYDWKLSMLWFLGMITHKKCKQSTEIIISYYVVKKHLLGLLFVLRW